ncbi:MAG: SDR family oxidoreductase [Elusimicrobia bacterium]|nr:SDR family oxidoreductase [Elusimicrobiota bacterium]
MKTKIALVTGASQGIGHAIAKRLRQEDLEVLTPSLEKMNLLSDISIDAYLAELKKPVDILINNAGINILGSGIEVSDETIKQMTQVNLLAPLRLARAIAPGMIERKYGRIVNISSIWSAITKPRRVTYSMTKAGLNGLTRTLAVELAPYNVLVNAVAPGYVNTELTKQNNSPADLEKIRNTIPLGRLAEPDEIAELVAFLCSAKNTYITGQVIVADGGFICL